MDPEMILEGIFTHFQDMNVAPGRSRELMTELLSVNEPVRELYDHVADFDAQPGDFQSALLALRREESRS